MTTQEKRKSSKSISSQFKEQSATYYALESSASGATTRTTSTTINCSVQCNGQSKLGIGSECHSSILDSPSSIHGRGHPHHHLFHKYFDDIEYATVKGTPRLLKPVKNIYDCPVPVTKNYQDNIETDLLRVEFGSGSRSFINSM